LAILAFLAVKPFHGNRSLMKPVTILTRRPASLAEGLAWCLENNQDNRQGKAGLGFVRQELAPSTIARQFQNLPM
jgi:hypothetical protein